MAAAYIIDDDASFFQIAGNGAAAALDALTVLACADLPIGGCRYNLILDATGKIVSDLTVLRMAENDCLVVAPTLAADALFALLDRALPATIELEDHSNALVLLERFGGGDDDLPEDNRWCKLTTPSGVSAIVFECGGSYGYILAEGSVEALAEELAAADEDELDSAERTARRIEAGRPMFASELSPRLSPLEAGLAGMVEAASGRRYPGSMELMARQPEYRTVRADFNGTKAPRPGTPIKLGGREAGIVTCAAFSARLNLVVAYLRIKANCEAVSGANVVAETGKTPILGKIV